MQLFYSDQFSLPLPPGHRFPISKYRQLREHLEDCNWCDSQQHHFCVPPAANDVDLLLVHHADYVDRMVHGRMQAIEMRRIGFPWSAELVTRSRRSVGGTIAAARAALCDRISVNLAGGTHHAFADAGQGFCVFNDAAVASRVAQRDFGVQRVLIVDLDVHQGNGTAAIFQHDPTVYTFSMHSEKNYPFRKHAADLDVSLSDGTSDAEYLDQLDRSLDIALGQIEPQLVVYIAGADPYERDRLGRLNLSMQGLMARDRMVLTRCTDRAMPIAIAMGGGYASEIQEIVQIHANTVRVASELLR